jgi:uncharacterized damage-inducible protein DinB
MVPRVNALHVVQRLAENNAWSNLRLHRACARLAQGDLHAERTSFFKTIARTLNHILIVDWFYVDALESGGRGRSVFDDEEPFDAMEPLARAQREVDARLVAYTRGLAGEAALDAPVRMERSDHVQVERAGDVLLHLSTHQIHHRGQVHAMLSGTRVEPPQLDEFFMSEELPLREEELRALELPLR